MPLSRSDLDAAIRHYHDLVAASPAGGGQVDELVGRQREETILLTPSSAEKGCTVR